MTTSRAARILEAGFTAFAATTGAILMFGRTRGGVFAPFAAVGRRVARDMTLPTWSDAAIGLVVHLGQSLALGALTVLLAMAMPSGSRVRAALVTVLLWQASSMLPWFAAIRPDATLGLSVVARGGLAMLLVVALVLGSRGRTQAIANEYAELD